jgi:hypothetical protein
MTYTIFTESTSDHSRVHVIAEADEYADATRIARRVSGIIAFTDQFQSRYTPTSINGMNGTLA